MTTRHGVSPTRYPIRAVARLTGISIDTLRAWERRYHVVTPHRDDRGRAYSEEDVQRLRLVQAAVQRGHAIGRVAGSGEEELRRLVAGPAPTPGVPRPGDARIDLSPLMAHVAAFDAALAQRELSRLAAVLPPREFVRDVVLPLMRKVGDEWYGGRLSVAQEHMISGALRNLLGSLAHAYARASVPATVLFATPSGERHEFGILAAAMLAAAGGLGLLYLGADLPGDEIADAARRGEVRVVILGLVRADDGRDPARHAQHVAARLAPEVELWLGGRGAERAARDIGARALVLPDFTALEEHLVRLGAKF